MAEDLEYQESADYRQDREYWLGRLAGIPEPASAVARTARAARGSLVHRGNLPDGYVEGLHRLAPILRVNWPAVIVAGVANYLGGVTGNTDILLGLTTTGRSGAVARSTPGQVSNVVPLRLSVTPWTRTAELVGQTSARMREALAAQRFRGEVLRRELDLGDDRSLVGWRVNVMPFKFDATFGGHRVVMRTLSTGPVDDVIVNVYTRIGVPGLQVDLEANPDLYTESELAAHHARLLTCLREMIEKADPDRPVARYPVATDTDRDRVPIRIAAWMRSPGKARTPDGPGTTYDEFVISRLMQTARLCRSCPLLFSKKISPHVLRHSTAMRLLHAGVDTTVIALWLGHESVATTQVCHSGWTREEWPRCAAKLTMGADEDIFTCVSCSLPAACAG